jgi:hypothetical protein
MIGKPSRPVRREAARKRTCPTGTSPRGRPIRLADRAPQARPGLRTRPRRVRGHDPLGRDQHHHPTTRPQAARDPAATTHLHHKLIFSNTLFRRYGACPSSLAPSTEEGRGEVGHCVRLVSRSRSTGRYPSGRPTGRQSANGQGAQPAIQRLGRDGAKCGDASLIVAQCHPGRAIDRYMHTSYQAAVAAGSMPSSMMGLLPSRSVASRNS